jgi:8-oxo-dGTP pyrophosphatase MutT (NUDIX family)
MVVFDGPGRVLLGEPTNQFEGYVWTCPKGGPDAGEHSVETALRETLEETGHRLAVVGHLLEGFQGSSTGSENFVDQGYDIAGQVDLTLRDQNGETAAIAWPSPDEARLRIVLTTNTRGRSRDLLIPDAAVNAALALGILPARPDRCGTSWDASPLRGRSPK